MTETLQSYLELIGWRNLFTAGGKVVLVLLLAWLAVRLSGVALRRLERSLVEDEPDLEDTKRTETLMRLLRQGIYVVVAAVTLLMVLSELGVDIAPVLASAGILGLAVGFGAQNLVRDVISGFFIVLENQVRVGDVAVVNGTGGLVEQINLRTIVLRDIAGVVHVFPNGTINTLANMTKEWSAYILEIGVAYKEETDRVVEIMKDVGAELRQDPEWGPLIIEDLEIFGVDKLADSAVVIKARLKTEPIEQWKVGRQYLRRLKMAFDASGVEIPFPHRALYFGEASKPVLAQLLEARGRVEEGAKAP
jgi:small conductance mechanosensitive channel